VVLACPPTTATTTILPATEERRRSDGKLSRNVPGGGSLISRGATRDTDTASRTETPHHDRAKYSLAK